MASFVCSCKRQAVCILLLLWLNLYSLFQRWLKQALEEEGSTSPARRPSLFMPCEGPLSPSINGDSDSPLPYNGTCSLPGSLFVGTLCNLRPDTPRLCS